jgi:hypothetical protein
LHLFYDVFLYMRLDFEICACSNNFTFAS